MVCIQKLHRQVERVIAHQALGSVGGFKRGAQRAPLLIRLGTFNAQSCFFPPAHRLLSLLLLLLLPVAVQEWPKPKAAIQIRFHLNQLGESERERGREGLSISLLPNPEILTKKKGGVSGVRETQRNPEEFPRIFPPVYIFPNTPRHIKHLKVGGEAAGTVVKDGRAASVDALPRGRHGRTPRPGAAYAGWHGGDGRGGKKARHRRHTTANNDHHRPKLRRSAGEVRLPKEKKTKHLRY